MIVRSSFFICWNGLSARTAPLRKRQSVPAQFDETVSSNPEEPPRPVPGAETELARKRRIADDPPEPGDHLPEIRGNLRILCEDPHGRFHADECDRDRGDDGEIVQVFRSVSGLLDHAPQTCEADRLGNCLLRPRPPAHAVHPRLRRTAAARGRQSGISAPGRVRPGPVIRLPGGQAGIGIHVIKKQR